MYEDKIVILDVFSGFEIANQLVYSGFFGVMTEFVHECYSDELDYEVASEASQNIEQATELALGDYVTVANGYHGGDHEPQHIVELI